MTRLRYRAEINPDTPGFAMLPDDTEIAFLPLEAVWADARLDVSRRRAKHSVRSGYTRFQSGDVIVPKITPTFQAGRANIVPGVPHDVAAGTTELHIVRPIDIDVGYLRYLMHTAPFLQGGESEMTGVAGQKRVPDVWLRDMPVPVDDSTTQRKIAGFLDRETERIDALVDKKRRLIDLLEEKRTATITQAVTKGLDPTAPMKDSTIPWIGTIPSHWSVMQLKFVANLKSGDNITSDSIDESGRHAVYGGNGLRGYTSSFTHSGSYVLIGRQGALAGNINYATGEFFASEHAVIATPLFDLPPKWLGEVLRVMNLNQYSKAAAQPGIAVDVIKNLALPVPPHPERHAIAAAVDHTSAMIGTAEEKLHQQLSLLAEYREALITAAVTGEIDVDTFDNDRHREEVSA